MQLPFTQEQFLEVFRNYNSAVYPMQILFYLLAWIIVLMVFKKSKYSGHIIAGILAFFWFWMGIMYHILYFSAINKAAFLFGGVFILQGILILIKSVYQTKVSFYFSNNIQGIAGGAFIAYALIIYPVLSNLLGHTYPASPTFGLPCPTTIFTFGIFLWSVKKLPFVLLLVPFLWSIVGFSASINLGMPEDIGLIVAGIAGSILIVMHNRQNKQLAF